MISKIFKIREERFVKKIDVWSAIFFIDPLAIPLTKLLHKTRITPNQVSISTVIFSLLAAFFFVSNQKCMGGALFYVGYLLDYTDGKLARLRGTQSEFGKKLDAVCDHFNKLIVFLALSYSQFYILGGSRILILGLILISIHYLLHLIHRILLIKNTYKGYPGYREVLIFKKDLGERFIKKGFLPSLYSYADEKFLFFVIAPVFGIFRQFLIISLFLSLMFKVLPEIILLLSKKKLAELHLYKI